MAIPAMRYERRIEGISAVLLPFHSDGRIDYASYIGLVERTWTAGLTPAVNMDTGYVNLLTLEQRREVLGMVREIARGRSFVAGAFIEGRNGDPVRLYIEECDAITAAGGTPILFPCSALGTVPEEAIVSVYRAVGDACEAFLGFELGRMFVPFGRIWELDTFRSLLSIPQLKGAKHSSLSRHLEWERLRVRDETRPDFRVYTGNDLAIDMVQWGSDYLLGLSAFHVEAFALRDRHWADGDPAFYEINDWLQYLGMLAFRSPVPAYKHTCAQFLKLRGVIPNAMPHPEAPRRPESDIAVLESIARRLDELCQGGVATSGR
jgi:dihydrodipicolinate synthase/N-acetylneuraminate lyase